MCRFGNEPDWAAIRDQILLDPTIVNLNTGSFGPLPGRCSTG